MTPHTPGEWKIEARPKDNGIWRIMAGHNGVATTWNDEGGANAHLIAAAPDLFDALLSIENDDGSIPETIWKMRNDAIAKARGEK